MQVPELNGKIMTVKLLELPQKEWKNISPRLQTFQKQANLHGPNIT